MTWRLFIDDLRQPIRGDCIVARTSQEAIDAVKTRGMPIDIMFDHDLGFNDTSIEFIRWLEEELVEKRLKFPRGFNYSIHSQNPVGRDNIKNRMEALLKYFPPSLI